MNRLKRFRRNAGIRGSGAIRVLLLLFGLGFLVVHDIQSGFWVYSLPLLAATFLVTYLVRNWLVEHFAIARVAMNVLLVVAVVISTIPSQRESDSPWLNALIVGFLGAYLGCYFWLLSDERIEVPRPIRTP